MVSLITLLMQIAVIVVASRLVGWVFRRFHQPQVVGEMFAGILLGPSLLGWVAPSVSAALFPTESLGMLNALSQIGLLLFMFLVGLEFDPQILRGRGRTAFTTSYVSIIIPFVLGALLALLLYDRLSDPGVPFLHFALFMGMAMSITAFPVLARILTELDLLKSRVGTISLACAAVDDVTAWCILAGLVFLVRSATLTGAFWLMLCGVALYIALMVFGLRRPLGRLERLYQARGAVSQELLALTMLLMLASAWITEWLGIHALFGAFLLGAVMPKTPGFVHALSAKFEDIVVVLLLPLFFAFTGLRTSLGSLDSPMMWLYAIGIIAVAIIGKLGGATISTRFSGLSWRESSAVGLLMNTRGLMELVVLNIGLDLGVISPTLFTMMVLMALITTFMTTPLLKWIYFPVLHEQAASASSEVAA